MNAPDDITDNATGNVLSVQSRVAWGYVGNAVAVPTIQAMGLHAWPVDTVRLAHHPGHGRPAGSRTPADEVEALVRGVRQMLEGEAAMLTGYLGTAEQGRRALRAGAGLPLYLDPAFGDDAEGIYVDEAIVEFFVAEAVPAATAVMPNRFELARLTGQAVETPADAVAAARALMARGPATVMVSSVPLADGRIGNVLTERTNAWLAAVPRLPLRAKGTGDMLSAAFATGLCAGQAPERALCAAVGAVNVAVEDAAARRLRELDLPAVLGRLHRAKEAVATERIG